MSGRTLVGVGGGEDFGCLISDFELVALRRSEPRGLGRSYGGF